MQLFLNAALFVGFCTILIVPSTTKCYETAADKVDGACGPPNLPSKSRIRFVSPEKSRFAENETIYVICEQNQFPHHLQKKTCRHGQWHGSQARCGKAVSSNVVSLEAFHCEDTYNRILSLELNQTDVSKHPLPTNSFHFSRVSGENVALSVSGSNCYRWLIKFESKIEIAFLLIDFNLGPKVNGSTDTPVINVDSAHRMCKLQHTSLHVIEEQEIFGFYFFCNLKTATAVDDPEQLKTDYLVVDIQCKSPRTVSLEAVFVGETYKKTINKKLVPDCGRLEIQKTGVIMQVELGYVQVYCNDSFVEIGGIIKKHKFICDLNGQWQGEWPQCIPKTICSREQITEQLPLSIVVEQIGNVFYLNDTEWVAINHSWVRYSCSNSDGIMVGKYDRICMAGKWSNKMPNCIQGNIAQEIRAQSDPNCDPGWLAFKDEKCFKILDSTTRTYADAMSSCTTFTDGAILPTIHSQDEQEFLSNYLFMTSKSVDNFWIGAQFVNNNVFEWVDKSDFSYTNWDSRGPRRRANYCVQMQFDETDLGKWFDDPCEKKYAVVCQKMQTWSLARLQQTILDTRKEMRDANQEANKKIDEQKYEIDILKQNQIPIGFIYTQLSIVTRSLPSQFGHQ